MGVRVLAIAAALLVAAYSGAADDPPLALLRELLEDGKYREAEAAARAGLKRVEDGGGGDSLEAATVLQLLVDALCRGGKGLDPETEALGRRQLSIRERHLGPEHPDLAAGLRTLGYVHGTRREFAAAEPLLDRALAIEEKVLGPDALEVAETLTHLGVLYRNRAESARARQAFERALAIRTRLGLESTAIGSTLIDLARVIHDTGDFAEARPFYERGVAMVERVASPDHPVAARGVSGLALLLREAADYGGARPLYERVLATRERLLGPDHPDVAASANNLANLYAEMGEFPEAKRLYERAIAIRERAAGPLHPNIRLPLQNLAEALHVLGDDKTSRRLLERALAIARKAFGDEHPFVADTMHHLGVLLADSGLDPVQGRALVERSLAIREKQLGADHPDTAKSRLDAGRLMLKAGDPEAARPQLERALQAREAKFGPDHPNVAEALSSIAELRALAGDRAGARAAFERVVGIREKAFGPWHPLTALAWSDLSAFLGQSGEPGPALDAALKAETLAREHLVLTMRALSERQALIYASTRAPGLDLALALLAAPGRTAGREAEVLDALVRSRAVVLDEMASRHRAVAGSGDPSVAALVSTLVAARERFARLVVRGPGDDAAGPYRTLVEGARREKDSAEEALAARSLPFREEQARTAIGLAEVAANVPPGSALVSFARSRAGYVAFVLKGGAARPDVVVLGAADAVEAAVARWRAQVLAESVSTGVGTRRAAAAYERAATALRQIVWDPVERRLGRTVRDVHLVPDGALHLVSYAALPRGGGRYLVEDGPVLHYLTAERDLVPAMAPEGGAGLLALGDPAFDAPLSAAALPSEPVLARAASSGKVFRGVHSSCPDFAALRFEPLPASRREIREVSALYASGERGGEALRRDGTGASEAAFKALAPGRRYLHLATHGFFIPEACAQESNPLLRGGLALAGANHRTAAAPGEEDGILTAEEVGALDLRGVEWAVLSACDTGLGDIRAGEGVLGLRRAFRVAGVRATIMSLWPVEDESIRQWTEALYRERFERDRSPAASVHHATLDVLRARRRRGLGTHPFHWAGFVAAGTR